jgi:hypothetical protein
MSANIFDFVSDELERLTGLGKLEARGTVRLALKAAGLDARTVTTQQMVAMLEKVMPSEMKARGVANGEQTCKTLVTSLEAAHPSSSAAPSPESPEAIFRRLAQS